MNRIEAICSQPGCDRRMVMEIDGEVGRWATLIRTLTICDECEARLELEERDHEQARKIDERRRACGLPPALRGITVEDLDGNTDGRALGAVMAWIAEPRGLVLTGDVGVGKTTLAAVACRALLAHMACRYLRGAGVMSTLGRDFADLDRRRLIKLLESPTAIVLDDIDKMRSSDYGRERLFDAIDSRLQHEAPILVTTNLMPSELGARFGDAIKSRLTGDYFRVIKVTGADRRLAARRADSDTAAGVAIAA